MKCPCVCHHDMGMQVKSGLSRSILRREAKGLWRFRCDHCWSVGEWDLSVPIKGVEFTIL